LFHHTTLLLLLILLIGYIVNPIYVLYLQYFDSI